MSGLFGGKTKTVITSPAPAPPQENDLEVQEAIRRERELSRRRKGRRGTILTGSQGLYGENTGQKTLG